MKEQSRELNPGFSARFFFAFRAPPRPECVFGCVRPLAFVLPRPLGSFGLVHRSAALRISAEADHPFRLKLTTCFGSI